MPEEKKPECPHLWEGSEYGTECCALCGATTRKRLALVPTAEEKRPLDRV